MSETHANRIRELFDTAVKLPANEQEAWLIEACGNDSQLLKEVCALLDQDSPTIDEDDVQLDDETSSCIEVARQAGGIHVRCPHCRNPVELVADESFEHIVCKSCGSQFSLIGTDSAEKLDAHVVQSLGHFDLIEKVGMGGFGSVYKAKDTKLDRYVAIKVPRKQQLSAVETEKFLREARAGAQLRHPNIVSVYEVGRVDDQIYIVSDFVEGVTLRKWMSRLKPTPRESARLCVKIARALDYAHEQGVIHRDLKPGNIMLDANDEPYLMDFGLAKRVAGEITMTVEGQILGTPAYMSPEQARGEGNTVDRRTDVYAMGVILFELLTGELPFRGDVQLLLHQLLTEEAPSPRKFNGAISSDLETICLKCMEKQPDKRYSTAAEIADDIERHLEHRPIEARPISSVERLWRWCRRRPAIATLTATLLLSLLIGTIVSAYFAVQASNKASELAQSLETERGLVAEKEKLIVDLRAANEAETKARHATTRTLGFFERYVLSAARPPGQEGGLGRNVSVRAALEAAEPQIAVLFKDDPLVETSIRIALGRTYYYMMERQLAVAQYERSAQLLEDMRGPSHPDTLNIKSELLAARSIGSDDDQNKIIEDAEQVLAESRRTLGERHPRTLKYMFQLAVQFVRVGRLEEAIALLEPITTPEAEAALDRNQVLSAMTLLAEAYHKVRQSRAALSLITQVLEERIESDGPEDIKTIEVRYQRALILVTTEGVAAAIPELEKVVADRMNALGADHITTLASMNILADTYRLTNRIEEAIGLRETVLKRAEEKYEEDSTSLTIQRLFLAVDLAHDSKRDAEALEMMKRLSPVFLEMVRNNDDALKAWGSNWPSAYASAAGTCLYRESHELAEVMARICLVGQESVSPDAWQYFNAMALLGGSIAGHAAQLVENDPAAAQKRFEEAEPLLLKGYEGMMQRFADIPSQPPSLREIPQQALGRINKMYEAWDRPGEARVWRVMLKEAQGGQEQADKIGLEATELIKAGKLNEAIEKIEAAPVLPAQFTIADVAFLHAQTMNWAGSFEQYNKIYPDSWQTAIMLFALGREEEYRQVRRKLLQSYGDAPPDWMPSAFLGVSQYLPLEEDLWDAYRKVAKDNSRSEHTYRQQLIAAMKYRVGEFDAWYAALPDDSPLRDGNVTGLIAAIALFEKNPSAANRKKLEEAIAAHDQSADRLHEDGYLEGYQWDRYIELKAWVREARQIMNGQKLEIEEIKPQEKKKSAAK